MLIHLNRKELICSTAFCYNKIKDSNISDDIEMGWILIYYHIFLNLKIDL